MVWHRVGAHVATGVARRDGGRMAEKGGQNGPPRASYGDLCIYCGITN